MQDTGKTTLSRYIQRSNSLVFFNNVLFKMTNNAAKLILREKVDFALHQHDQNRYSKVATAGGCFVLFGTRQHDATNLNNASSNASANKLNNPYPI